jgi:hypothetical protein
VNNLNGDGDTYKFFHHSDAMAEMKINTSSLDYSVLKHFGLIEARINDNPELKDSGYWRITKKGFQFVVGTITIPKRVHIYNNRVYGFSEEHTNIQESLGDQFSYKDFLLTPVPIVRK